VESEALETYTSAWGDDANGTGNPISKRRPPSSGPSWPDSNRTIAASGGSCEQSPPG